MAFVASGAGPATAYRVALRAPVVALRAPVVALRAPTSRFAANVL